MRGFSDYPKWWRKVPIVHALENFATMTFKIQQNLFTLTTGCKHGGVTTAKRTYFPVLDTILVQNATEILFGINVVAFCRG